MDEEKKSKEKKKQAVKKERPPKKVEDTEEAEVKSNGLPEDVDFKKFLGCGG